MGCHCDILTLSSKYYTDFFDLSNDNDGQILYTKDLDGQGHQVIFQDPTRPFPIGCSMISHLPANKCGVVYKPSRARY